VAATRKEVKPSTDPPKALTPVAEAGRIVAFSARALAALPGSLKYTAEVLRQTALLVTGTTLVLLALVALIGGECALFFVYLTRPLGGTDFTGFFEVPCGIRELFPYMFGYIFAAKVGCGLVAEIGSMRISDEIDALESVGMDPMRYVVGTRLLAVIIYVPLVYMMCIIAGLLGGWLVSVLQIGELTGARYFQGYWTSQGLVDNVISMVKTCRSGSRSRSSACTTAGRRAGARSAWATRSPLDDRQPHPDHLLGAFWSLVFFSRGANYPFGG
jgi:phospholipid/cholesterol/gamma-HCH transport system permease protein